MNLPAEADSRHKAIARALRKLQGANFDKAYMAQAGVSAHTNVHKALTRHRERASDQGRRALIARMLPTVEQHLHHAIEMGDSVTTAAK